MLRVADYIVGELRRNGVDRIFMLPGGMIMHLMDAVGCSKGLKYYCSHHEQASAMAADGYAKESGKLGVCFVTSGPAATNILTGLVGSYQDSVPLLFITGQCKLKETIQGRKIKGLRQCGFLEADIVPIVKSVTKYAAFVDDPRDIRMHLEKAIHLATTGRPGPVLLDIPLDIQGASIDPEKLKGYAVSARENRISAAHIERLMKRLHASKRPMILAGHGIRVAGMVSEFKRLVSKLKVPVATTLMAKDLLPYDHPYFAGHPGPRAQRGANFSIQSADLIISMGSSLNIQTVGYEGELFAPNAYKIQIDCDSSLLKKQQVGVNWQLKWDIKDYIPTLLNTSLNYQKPREWIAWAQTIRQWNKKYSSRTESHYFGGKGSRVNLYEFIQVLSELTHGEETLLTDAGQPHPIFGQALEIKGNQRYLNQGSFAGMGYALPAAIGAAIAAPRKTIIPTIGDGSFQTNIHELQTVYYYQSNLKIFVINNDGYASMKTTQNNFFKGRMVASTRETGVTMPDTKKIAYAYGIPYVVCRNRGELRRKVSEVLGSKGPVICEIFALTDQRIFPAVPSQMLPNGQMKSLALDEMMPSIGQTLSDVQKEAQLTV